MVPSWLLWLVEILIFITCSLLIPEEVVWVLRQFGERQMHPSLHSNLKKLLALEILSFVSLFGIGMALLEYHRFVAGIVVFAVATALLGASLLLAVFSFHSKLAKVPLIVSVFVFTLLLFQYLMGIVDQASTEYNEHLIREILEQKPTVAVTSRHDTPVKRPSPSTPHATKHATNDECTTNDLSVCSVAVILLRVEEMAKGIGGLYEQYSGESRDAREKLDKATDNIQRESVRFSFEAKTDMILNQYRSKYRTPAKAYRQEMENRIGPEAHDEDVLKLYDVPDQQTQKYGDKIIFLSNRAIIDLPRIAADLRKTAAQLQAAQRPQVPNQPPQAPPHLTFTVKPEETVYLDAPYCKNAIIQSDVDVNSIGLVITLSAPIKYVRLTNADVMLYGTAVLDPNNHAKAILSVRGAEVKAPLRPERALIAFLCSDADFNVVSMERFIVPN